MAVYYAYRCDEMGPADLYRRRFEDVTVLDWFRRHWAPLADLDEAERYTETALGVRPYGFARLFLDVHENGRPPPSSMRDVVDAICHALDWRAVRWEDHCLQVLVQFDGHESAFYFFDDDFARQRPDLTAYLLHDGPLPDGAGEPGWQPDATLGQRPALSLEGGEGRLYVIPFFRGDDWLYEYLDENNPDVIAGVRLPELARLLMITTPDVLGDDWGLSCIEELRDVLLENDLTEDAEERAFVRTAQQTPDDEVTWRAYADWLMERDGPSPGCRLLRLALRQARGLYSSVDPGRNVVHVGEHVAQVSYHAGDEAFDQLILFDDLWAAAHPILANALLRYGSRWDILSTGNENHAD